MSRPSSSLVKLYFFKFKNLRSLLKVPDDFFGSNLSSFLLITFGLVPIFFLIKLNKNSIGIELVNKGHKFGYTNFKKKQLSSLIKICKNLIRKYRIKKQNIVGHSDVAPLRKIDPGEKFPWKELAYEKIGIWHNCNTKILKKLRKVRISSKFKLEFINNLIKIGYYFDNKKKANFTKVIKAFQRHYRKKLINGIIDNECLLISKNI